MLITIIEKLGRLQLFTTLTTVLYIIIFLCNVQVFKCRPTFRKKLYHSPV